MGTTIGFIGLGTMGSAIARCLLARGYEVTGYDLSEGARIRAAADGVTVALTAAEAITGNSIVFSSLPTPDIVNGFWKANAGALAEGATLVETSTIDPKTSRELADFVEGSAAPQQRSIRHYVTCTVGKTPAHAEKGEQPFFLGGGAETKRAVLPVLESVSSQVIDMGTVEGAAIFKLISNLLGMTNMVTLAEGYALACSEAIKPDAFEQALRQTGAWSAQCDMRLEMLKDGDFTTKFALDLAAKDIRLSTVAAAENGIPTPTGSAALATYLTAALEGWGDADASAVINALQPRKNAN